MRETRSLIENSLPMLPLGSLLAAGPSLWGCLYHRSTEGT